MLKTSQTIPDLRGQTQKSLEILPVFLTPGRGACGVSSHLQVNKGGWVNIVPSGLGNIHLRILKVRGCVFWAEEGREKKTEEWGRGMKRKERMRERQRQTETERNTERATEREGCDALALGILPPRAGKDVWVFPWTRYHRSEPLKILSHRTPWETCTGTASQR